MTESEKSEICIKWESWIESKEGQIALAVPNTVTKNFIKERLGLAFLAGTKAQEEIASEMWDHGPEW